jgi:hypothetical protein
LGLKLKPPSRDAVSKLDRVAGEKGQAFELRENQARLRTAIAVKKDRSKTGAIFLFRRQHGLGIAKHAVLPLAGKFGEPWPDLNCRDFERR